MSALESWLAEMVERQEVWQSPIQRETIAQLFKAIRLCQEATAILEAILAADERGQGQPFAEAMERAAAFVRAASRQPPEGGWDWSDVAAAIERGEHFTDHETED